MQKSIKGDRLYRDANAHARKKKNIPGGLDPSFAYLFMNK